MEYNAFNENLDKALDEAKDEAKDALDAVVLQLKEDATFHDLCKLIFEKTGIKPADQLLEDSRGRVKLESSLKNTSVKSRMRPSQDEADPHYYINVAERSFNHKQSKQEVRDKKYQTMYCIRFLRSIAMVGDTWNKLNRPARGHALVLTWEYSDISGYNTEAKKVEQTFLDREWVTTRMKLEPRQNVSEAVKTAFLAAAQNAIKDREENGWDVVLTVFHHAHGVYHHKSGDLKFFR